jgi:hypothetical protein
VDCGTVWSLLMFLVLAETMYELVEELKNGAGALKRHTPNPISLSAGADLFIRYVTTAPVEHNVRSATRAPGKAYSLVFPRHSATTRRVL